MRFLIVMTLFITIGCGGGLSDNAEKELIVDGSLFGIKYLEVESIKEKQIQGIDVVTVKANFNFEKWLSDTHFKSDSNPHKTNLNELTNQLSSWGMTVTLTNKHISLFENVTNLQKYENINSLMEFNFVYNNDIKVFQYVGSNGQISDVGVIKQLFRSTLANIQKEYLYDAAKIISKDIRHELLKNLASQNHETIFMEWINKDDLQLSIRRNAEEIENGYNGFFGIEDNQPRFRRVVIKNLTPEYIEIDYTTHASTVKDGILYFHENSSGPTKLYLKEDDYRIIFENNDNSRVNKVQLIFNSENYFVLKYNDSSRNFVPENDFDYASGESWWHNSLSELNYYIKENLRMRAKGLR